MEVLDEQKFSPQVKISQATAQVNHYRRSTNLFCAGAEFKVSWTFACGEVRQIASDRLEQSVFRLRRNRHYLHPTPKTALCFPFYHLIRLPYGQPPSPQGEGYLPLRRRRVQVLFLSEHASFRSVFFTFTANSLRLFACGAKPPPSVREANGRSGTPAPTISLCAGAEFKSHQKEDGLVPSFLFGGWRFLTNRNFHHR